MGRTKYVKVWNLDSLFPEGSKSTQFQDHVNQLETDVSAMELYMEQYNKSLSGNANHVKYILEQLSKIRLNLSQANSYITCLLAQNTKDHEAYKLKEVTSSITARYDSILKIFQHAILRTTEQAWQKILGHEVLKDYSFILNNWRSKAERYENVELEGIISDLKMNGFDAWEQFYRSLIGSIKVKVKKDGALKEFSVGQTINLRSHADENVRKTAHEAMENVWREKQDIFAQILNRVAGFRIQINRNRGIDTLSDSLFDNRMTEKTLNAMWSAVNKYKHPFTAYLNEKAKLYGDNKMKSYNFWAPIGDNNQSLTYDDAVDFILEKFSNFGDESESFSQQAFHEGWIEAENRANKSPIAFCASFPRSGESRVFMTFNGSMTNVLTLAHELGHAFHNEAMKSVHGFNRQYPLTMAETASTFSEQIILDAALEKAESAKEKLQILDEKLKRSVMNFMNMHSRFLFEKWFYAEREKGYVSATKLNELMQDAFEVAYDGSFDQPSLYSWVWTPHYYLTQSPFYNYPYTFGYLFSISLYAKAKEVGKGFEKDYISLLRDSGSMSIEELMKEHLGEDITSEEFWEKGLKLCVRDAEDFIELVHDMNQEDKK